MSFIKIINNKSPSRKPYGTLELNQKKRLEKHPFTLARHSRPSKRTEKLLGRTIESIR